MNYLLPISITLIVGFFLFKLTRHLERKTGKTYESLGEWGTIVILLIASFNIIVVNNLPYAEWNVLIVTISYWALLEAAILIFGRKSN